VDKKHDVDATISELVVAFPAAFTHHPERVRPLKLGIKDDLYTRSAISRRRITAALRSYCNFASYLTATKQGAVRVDLDGQPTGTVTEAQAKHATEALSAPSKRGSEVTRDASDPQTRKATNKRTPPPGGTEPAPKRSMIITQGQTPTQPAETRPRRLSLADLRKAAAARKGKS
jgi:sRNA-binding protein